MDTNKSGAELIAAERQRQIEKEGWTLEHDDRHKGGVLLLAGLVYLAEAQSKVSEKEQSLMPGSVIPLVTPSWWPWQDCDLKISKDQIRNLAKAGALISAEIDRLQRAKTKAV